MIPLAGAKFTISPVQSLHVSGQVDSGQGVISRAKSYLLTGATLKKKEDREHPVSALRQSIKKEFCCRWIPQAISRFFGITTPAKITGADDANRTIRTTMYRQSSSRVLCIEVRLIIIYPIGSGNHESNLFLTTECSRTASG